MDDLNGARSKLEKFPLEGGFVEGGSEIAQLVATVNAMANATPPSSWSSGSDPEMATRMVQKIGQDHLPRLLDIKKDVHLTPETNKLYIPTIRSLRDLGESDAFHAATHRDYFSSAGHIQIYTGRTLYTDIETLVRGDLAQRETLRSFETWTSNAFFKGMPVALIPRMGQTTLTVKIGDEREQPIHNLGDGVQSILILAFPLFLRENEPTLVFIEEPELFLHPWLQRVLLQTLSERFPLHQYFLTTHSNHFLDLTLDVESVSVFAFDKELNGTSGNERKSRYVVTNVSRKDRRPLEMLGVRNSSVLLTNCTVWVEGITDRRYVAQWLDLYQVEIHGGSNADRANFLKEDLHYSFVEYSGGNITHWSFLDDEGPDVDRLCGKLFLIADNDGATPESEKGKRQIKLTNKLGNRFCLLPSREIENLLTPRVLGQVLEAYGESHDNLKTEDSPNYQNESLGNFLEKVFIIDPGKKARKGSYAADSGTVSDKVKFCERAIAATKRFDDLSESAKEIAKKVYDFIKSAQG